MTILRKVAGYQTFRSRFFDFKNRIRDKFCEISLIDAWWKTSCFWNRKLWSRSLVSGNLSQNCHIFKVRVKSDGHVSTCLRIVSALCKNQKIGIRGISQPKSNSVFMSEIWIDTKRIVFNFLQQIGNLTYNTNDLMASYN